MRRLCCALLSLVLCRYMNLIVSSKNLYDAGLDAGLDGEHRRLRTKIDSFIFYDILNSF